MIVATLRLDSRLERDEFHLPKTVGRMLDQRQLEVRVGAGIAVPGEMLAARCQAGLLHGRG